MKVYKSTRARKAFENDNVKVTKFSKLENGDFECITNNTETGETVQRILTFADTVIICKAKTVGHIQFVADGETDDTPEIINA